MSEKTSYKIRWGYADKITISEGLWNYTDPVFLDELGWVTKEYMKELKQGKKMKEVLTMRDGGYGKFPLFYVTEDFSKYMKDLGYPLETHCLMVFIGAYMSTFVSRGNGLQAMTICRKLGIRLTVMKKLIEDYGKVYGLEWEMVYLPKEFRNQHYIKFNYEFLETASQEIEVMFEEDKK